MQGRNTTIERTSVRVALAILLAFCAAPLGALITDSAALTFDNEPRISQQQSPAQVSTLVRNSGPWRAILSELSAEYRVPMPVLRAVLSVESGGDLGKVNRDNGAIGLMQVRPEVASALGAGPGANLMLPETNIRLAAEYLRMAHNQFGNWDLAYAAYIGTINIDRSNPAIDIPDNYGHVVEFRQALSQQGYIESPAPVNGTALDWALEMLGAPYVWAGSSPSGFDCSGLVSWAYREAGFDMPRMSWQMWEITERVSYEQLQPGDIIFFGYDLWHVGIYAGNGYMVHAPREGLPVQFTSLSESFWAATVVGYGRVK